MRGFQLVSERFSALRSPTGCPAYSYICIHVHTHAYIDTHICVHTCACIRIRTYEYRCIHAYVCMRTRAYAYIRVHMHAYAGICIHMHQYAVFQYNSLLKLTLVLITCLIERNFSNHTRFNSCARAWQLVNARNDKLAKRCFCEALTSAQVREDNN